MCIIIERTTLDTLRWIPLMPRIRHSYFLIKIIMMTRKYIAAKSSLSCLPCSARSSIEIKYWVLRSLLPLNQAETSRSGWSPSLAIKSKPLRNRSWPRICLWSTWKSLTKTLSTLRNWLWSRPSGISIRWRGDLARTGSTWTCKSSTSWPTQASRPNLKMQV